MQARETLQLYECVQFKLQDQNVVVKRSTLHNRNVVLVQSMQLKMGSPAVGQTTFNCPHTSVARITKWSQKIKHVYLSNQTATVRVLSNEHNYSD